MNTNLTRGELKQIKAARQAIENQHDQEIDSLITARRSCRANLDGELTNDHVNGQGRRTLNTKASFRRTSIWSRPMKAKFGALD